MTVPRASRHWLVNSDGTCDGRYPLGDKPSGTPSLVWATSGYPIINTLVINHAYSANFVQFLSGTDAGSATLSLITVSGDDAAAHGWAIGPVNLTHPSNANTGSGVFKIRATVGATTSDSPNQTWAYLPPPEIQIKWNPGIYVILPGRHTYTDTMLNEICAVPNVVGVSHWLLWSLLEPTRGNYDFSYITTLYNKCAAFGKRLRIAVLNFGTASGFPTYLQTEPNAGGGYYTLSGGSGTRLKYHKSGLMDRWLALMAALGAALDSLPYFEGITNGDSLVQVGTEPADFVETDYITQYYRWIDAASTHFPTSNVWIGFDYGFAPANMPAIMARIEAHRCGVSGSDCITKAGGTFGDSSTAGMRVFRGGVWNGSVWIYNGIDYRGRVANSTEGQPAEYGGKENKNNGLPYTLDEILAHVVSVNGQQHYPITYKNYTASPTPPLDIYWDNAKSYATSPTNLCPDQKTWIAAGGHSVYSGAPTNYPAVVTGGT